MSSPQNEKRDRWYGVRPGDIVSMNSFNTSYTGLEVIDLHPMDNNGCTVRASAGAVFEVCPEWLTVEVKVEDIT